MENTLKFGIVLVALLAFVAILASTLGPVLQKAFTLTV